MKKKQCAIAICVEFFFQIELCGFGSTKGANAIELDKKNNSVAGPALRLKQDFITGELI